MNPNNSEFILGKQLAEKFNYHPRQRLFTGGNPILSGEIDAFRGPTGNLSVTKFMAFRPQGISTVCADSTRKSLNLFKQDELDQGQTLRFKDSVSGSPRKSGRLPLRNPILDGESRPQVESRGHSSQAYRSSVGQLINDDCPSNQMMSAKRQEKLQSRNRSCIFDLPTDDKVIRKKLFGTLKGEEKPLLRNEFCINESESPKQTVDIRKNEDVGERKKLAELFRLRTQYSGFDLG